MYAGIAMTALATGAVLLTVLTGSLRPHAESAERLDEESEARTTADDGSLEAAQRVRLTP
ncbi:hypothetical protein AHOG_27540 [Actinoalloteichus hoggarensis]|uniref:Uncharacterized protein n=2 Tax=Actinoalloteichus hoggarensis TaxID=1470176 RepID=A0A221WBA2_9PSEU|nr:hypothetical protein AHOG_27540 [Actinoalloteichus hoggarensis]